MAAIIGGVGFASPSSKDPTWRRGNAPSSHTAFFGEFRKPESKTHFTGSQHGRLEMLEQDFVHGGAAYKRNKQLPRDIVEDLSHVRISQYPRKEKLAEAPPTLGAQGRHPGVFGGFAAHETDSHDVLVPHLLENEQKPMNCQRIMAHQHEASAACYQFRARTPRGAHPQHLYNPRPPFDHSTLTNGPPLLGGESHGGNYGPPKHRDGTQKLSLEQHICPTPRGRHKRADHFEQNLHYRRDFWHPSAPGATKKLGEAAAAPSVISETSDQLRSALSPTSDQLY
eukprot:gnl/MRDRNA2_/MRDRNA2_70077_c0_seq1.p1 gnl/MRDRNA2_/MRDRNA2_70077_c0~~gnl/MRDRNA2_/MRDRNA2_70077_c0_seq1.p1  ORF type:complete len:300 (+),score=43.19 gnl/MRDRNA2_/MRDRNA2_70077_c0_seq1:57-902(+)